jgi:predicted nucleic acid-binding Zn ribbon protein
MSYREDSEKFSSMMAFGALIGIVVMVVLLIILK